MTDDIISRQEAIDAFYLQSDDDGWWTGTAQDIEELLKSLPAAQPERKKGRWEMKPDPYGFFDEIPVCSECGCTTKMREVYKFCPNCGADMREGQDG